ncbi:MAG: alpha-glucan family phosphorylase [Oligoflexales bacterium]|nr:alpha-glucan family phosphorylase [Oligoflexales bacterium]
MPIDKTPESSSSTNGEHIAYFSMEVGINPKMPTYSGGLGVLAGDTIQSAADLSCPLLAVSMLYRKGYFRQELDGSGAQLESPVSWFPEEFCQKLAETVELELCGRIIKIQALRYDVLGVTGHIVPIYFLDTDLESNSPEDRALSLQLYGGDSQYRLLQEAVLGMGGVLMLQKLGYSPKNLDAKKSPNSANNRSISSYHMNEGHAALLTLQLLQLKVQINGAQNWNAEDQSWVKSRCIFTTHTPVPAGHDCFEANLTKEVLGEKLSRWSQELGAFDGERLNMSFLAMRLSRYINGVSRRHGEVSQKLLQNNKITSVTNGVHAARWTSDAFQNLFDEVIPLWRQDNFYLRELIDVAPEKVEIAHLESKKALFSEIAKRMNVKLDPEIFTIGFARRATEYKRATLLFQDIERIKTIAQKVGPIQLVFSGKAHPKDFGGKALISSLTALAKQFTASKVQMVYIPNYDMELGRLICSGVDLWLNTPLKPLEASGTSGMKAALNGVPSLSTLDGWWVEGCVEGATGWEIEDSAYADDTNAQIPSAAKDAAASLYNKLETLIIPTFYQNKKSWAKIMRQCISLNGAYFTTQRMVLQYIDHAYREAKNGKY